MISRQSGTALRVKLICATASLGVLAGCQALPGEGPSALSIASTAGQSAAEQSRPTATVFDVVQVDAYSARLVADYTARMLNRRFGIGSAGNTALIGIGDQVQVTIFEAGESGLFSTAESKQTSLQLIVQPDGQVPIPYVGSVQFAGRTAEQVRQSILSSLRDKAVEPDVIITTTSTDSRAVTVAGAVNASQQVALSLSGDRIMDVIAKAGGPREEPYETYVTLTRGSSTGTVLLKTILEDPSENIFVQPNDQVFVTHDPRTFTILGQTSSNSRIPFGSNDLNLLEAIALAGGGEDASVDARGFFVFRYEEPEIVKLLVGEARLKALTDKGYATDKHGRLPIVYQFDMRNPDSLITGQTFPVKNRDVIYASRHPTVDIQRFLSLVSQPVGVASGVIRLSE